MSLELFRTLVFLLFDKFRRVDCETLRVFLAIVSLVSIVRLY